MEEIKKQLQNIFTKTIDDMIPDNHIVVTFSYPENSLHGDIVSNIALTMAKQTKKSSHEIATLLVEELRADPSLSTNIREVVQAGPGFINITFTDTFLINCLEAMSASITFNIIKASTSGENILVEYAHPNTHKEFHIGHMRTLITGEAISRILEATGANVFRANYQGDIGPHVAKALYGIKRLLQLEKLTLEEIQTYPGIKRAKFLGRAYALGSFEYEANKNEIDEINKKLYEKSKDIDTLYQITRNWSLEYFSEIYNTFSTQFDKLFFESEMVNYGKEIVLKNSPNIFENDGGTYIFPGEKYGLHNRVFITKSGYPTYEGKEMATAYREYEAFHFDRKIHIVANEQQGYFQVVFKAIELLDPLKFKDKQFHVSMGMVTLIGRKMSSRTGDVLSIDNLIEEVKEKVSELFTAGKISDKVRRTIVQQISLGAVKYSILKVSTGKNVAFDIEKSVALEGNSGPYLQYTYARTYSLLEKSDKNITINFKNYKLNHEEREVIRHLLWYEEIVRICAEELNTSLICEYLYQLAKLFNHFYQKHQIISKDDEVTSFRLCLTNVVSKTLKNGLYLLGIDAPIQM